MASSPKTVPEIAQDPDNPANLLDGFVGYNLKRAYMVFTNDFRRALETIGLSPRSFSVLTLIAQNNNITQSEISRRLGIERSGLVAIVDDLQEKGLTLRVPVPGDRRVQALILTEAGTKAHREAAQTVINHENALLSDFSDGERQQLLQFLARLRVAVPGSD